MATRRVKVSFDVRLSKEVDRQRRAKKEGRSAFIRRAVEAYLALQRRRVVDDAYRRAYSGRAQEVEDDFGELRGAQAWPDVATG